MKLVIIITLSCLAVLVNSMPELSKIEFKDDDLAEIRRDLAEIQRDLDKWMEEDENLKRRSRDQLSKVKDAQRNAEEAIKNLRPQMMVHDFQSQIDELRRRVNSHETILWTREAGNLAAPSNEAVYIVKDSTNDPGRVEKMEDGWGVDVKVGGSVTVELPRRYLVNSIRFYLSERSKYELEYKYRVEVSPDEETWQEVRDQTNEFTNGWQDIKMKRQQVRLVKISPTVVAHGDRNWKDSAYIRNLTVKFNMSHD